MVIIPTIYAIMAAQPAVEDIELTPSDIPGASLSEPFEAHTLPALRWWLKCRGDVAVPTSWKAKVIARYSVRS